MRHARLTFVGAFHHCMNRGQGGESIFPNDGAKRKFLEIVSEAGKKMRIRLLAYCVMDNHYHLALENSSGRLSDFFKLANGEYGIAYRRHHDERGYVFQGRFKSTILQDESYLLMVIAYILGNPVRAGVARDFLFYPWSSAKCYFSKDPQGWIDRDFVESLYGTKERLYRHVREWQEERKKLPVIQSAQGPALATDDGIVDLLRKCNRRSGRESLERRRNDDWGFEPVARIYQELGRRYGIDVGKADFDKRPGQRLRRELLVYLKDRAGLKYREIARMPEFLGVKMNSLGKMYQDGKESLEHEK